MLVGGDKQCGWRMRYNFSMKIGPIIRVYFVNLYGA